MKLQFTLDALKRATLSLTTLRFPVLYAMQLLGMQSVHRKKLCNSMRTSCPSWKPKHPKCGKPILSHDHIAFVVFAGHRAHVTTGLEIVMLMCVKLRGQQMDPCWSCSPKQWSIPTRIALTFSGTERSCMANCQSVDSEMRRCVFFVCTIFLSSMCMLSDQES